MKKRRFQKAKDALVSFKKSKFTRKNFRKSKVSVSLAWANIVTQALFPLGVAFTPAVMAETTDRKRMASRGEQATATAASRLANVLTSNDATQSAENLARGVATSKGNEAVQEWLNQFGSAKVQLDLDNDLALNGSQVDALFALEDTPSALTFSQLGLRSDADGDLTLNLGVGKRHFLDTQMFGYNLFLDRDIQGQHSRGGLGAEYMRDNLRLSTNTYLALDGWKDSKNLAGYNEKAASGFDVRAEGYIPALPQLGAKVAYEQYFGGNVGLFGKDKLQSNPHAISFGVNYTPIPLVTFGVDHKQGTQGMQDTQFNLAFNYAFGTAFSKQIQASNVAAKRSLAGSRYDLVDRNNEIVLQYQEQIQLSVSLPPSLQGNAGQTLSLQVKTTSKNGVTRYEWDDSLLAAAKGKVTGSGSHWQVTLPAYIPGGNNSYPLSLVVYDKAGNKSQVAQTQILVTGYGIDGMQATLQSSQTTLPADSQSNTTIVLTLSDPNQQPVTGIAGSIQLVGEFEAQQSVPVTPRAARMSKQSKSSGKVTAVTTPATQEYTLSRVTESPEQPGTYLATLTAGNLMGVVNMTAIVEGTPLANTNAKVTLVSSLPEAAIADNALTASNSGSTVADGKTSNPVTLPVVDAKGNPLPDFEVTFTVTQPDGSDSTVTVKTDQNGIATLPVTSEQAGTVTVTTNVGGKDVSVDIDFTADGSTATVTDGTLKAGNSGSTVADGKTSNPVTLPVVDANGNPVPDFEVAFTVTDTAGKQTTVTVKTDANGIATLPVTSEQAGTVTVTTNVGGKDVSVGIDFVADGSTATVADNSLTAGNTGSTVADGQTSTPVTLPVVDANGNPVPDFEVTFTVTKPDGSETNVTVKTDQNGIATLPVTSEQAGTVTVTTNVGGKDVSVGIDFIADGSTATVADDALKAGNAGSTVADGQASNPVTLPVVDANGNPVPDFEVTFTVTQPDGSETNVTVKTDANGIATLPVTSEQAGTVTVTTNVGGKDVSVGIDFVADGSTATVADDALKAGNAGSTVADGKASNPVTLPVVDANGNPVPDFEVTFTVTQPDGSDSTVTVKTDTNGIATLPVTSEQAGTVTVTTNVGGKDVSVGIDFIADGSTATVADGTLKAGNTGSTVADGKASNPVTLPVVDANGNPVPDFEVTFTVTQPDGSDSTVTVKTDANGIATLPVTSEQAGTVTVTTNVGGKDVSVGIDFIADGSTATVTDGTLKAGNAGSTVADGQASNPVTLPVVDANGNPLPDFEVTFTVTQPDGSETNVTVKTDQNGIATLPVTSEQAGTVTVTTNVGGKDVSVGIDFIADGSTATVTDNSLTAGNTGSTVADGKASNPVTLPVVDANGNPVPDFEVTFTVTQPDGSDSTVTVKTDANGIATLPVTSEQAGTVTVTTNVGGKDVSVGIDFIADGSTATVTDGTLKAGNAGSTVADGQASNPVTLPVVDANGNPVPDFEVTFTVTQPDGSDSTVTVKTDANGIATLPVTSEQAGTVTVTTNVGGKDVSVGIDFVADGSTATVADDALKAGNAGTTVADGQTSNPVTLPVVDANGNPVPDFEVTFTVTQPDGSDSTVTVKTDANGIATLPVTSEQAGTVTVTTNVGGKDVSVGIDFIADGSTATVADDALKAGNVGTTVADGQTSNPVTLPVVDANGNPVPDFEVTFTVTQPDGSDSTVTVKTDANGIATLPVTSEQAGTVTVTTNVGGKDVSVGIDFVADGSTATVADDALKAGNAGSTVADGKASNPVTLPVVDANGNPVPDFEVTFTVTQPDGSDSTVTVKTDANGIATLPVTSEQAGTVTVTTNVGGKDVSVGIDFIADGSTATVADDALKAGNVGTTVADGQTSNPVTLPVVDAKGNPVPDFEVTFTVTQPDGSDSTVTVKTDANGIATLPVTSEQAGTVTVTTNVGGKDVSVGIDFIADGSTATVTDGTLKAGNAGTTVADGQASNPVTLPVVDANGNPVPDFEVTFTVTQPDGSDSTVTVKTDANGIATLPVTSEQAGTVTVTTNVGGKDVSVGIDFVADGSTATVADDALKAGNAGSTVADGKASNPVTLPVVDANGNPVPDFEVTFTVTQPDGSDSTVTVKTDANGIATLPVTSEQAGTVTVTTNVGGKDVSVGIDFIADGSTATVADDALKAGNVGTTVADGQTSNPVTLPVVDANGNPVPDFEVTFTVTQPDGSDSTVTVKTDANGIATLPVTSEQAGTVTVTTNVGGKDVSVGIDFTADGSTATVTDAALKAGNAGTTVADGKATNPVTLPVVDANGNPLPDYEVTFTVTQPDGSDSTVTVKTDQNGIATLPVTSEQAGTVTVTANVGGKDVSVGIDFIADGSTATVTDNSLTAGNTGTTVADGKATNPVTLPVVDANGNPLPDYEVTFTVTQPDGSDSTVTVKTDANGIATLPVTSEQAGTVTVTTNVGGKDVSVGIDFIADGSTATVADDALKAGNAGSTVADGQASNPVTLPVVDANGNPVPDFEVTFTVTQPDGSDSTVTVKTDANGIATLPVTSEQAGTVTVTTNVGGKDVSVGIDFVADGSTATVADDALKAGNAGSTVADGKASNPVTLPVVDANGNPVPDFEVTFTVTQPDGSDSTVTVKTDANGIATLPVTSEQAGTVTVTTNVGGKDVSVGIDFIADGSTATVADDALKAGNVGTTVADGQTSNPVTLPVVDAKGNPVPDFEVTFTVTQPDGSDSTVTVKTDANGIATLPVTSEQAGTVTVTTNVGGKDVSVGIDFVADGSTATVADDALKAGNAGSTVADGQASNPVTLPVVDANGNPVPDFEVTFTVTQPDGSDSTVTVKTDTNGIATLPVTSEQAGTVTVTTNVGGKDASVTLNFVADSSTATIADNSLTAANSGNTPADGETRNTVTLPVVDANGNPVPDFEITFKVTDANGTTTDVVVKTDANGIATLPAENTTSSKAGNVTISTQIDGKDASVTLNFVADSSTATIADNSLTAANSGNTPADGETRNTVTLPVVDANGNPVPDFEVTFKVIDANGTTTDVVVKTDVNGIATLPAENTTSSKAGNVTISTQIDGKDASVTLSFVADSSTATIADNSMTATNSGSTPADGETRNTVTLPVVDANGNPVPDFEVTFKVTDANGTTTDVVVKTDANGIATLPAENTTSSKAGNVTISTQIDGKDASVTLNFVADSSTATIADNSLTAANSGNTPADGETRNTVTLPVVDANGNPVPDFEVTFKVIDANGTTTDVVVKTDVNGIATLPAENTTSSKAGNVTISTQIDGKDASVTLNFVADSSTATIADNSLTAANSGNTPADGETSNTVTLPVVDANGNPVPDFEVTFKVTDANGTTTDVVVKTDANGIATLPAENTTSSKAGNVTISTQIDGKDASVTLNFVADSSTATIADDALKAGNAGTTVADGETSNTVTLPVVDANGNPLQDFEVTFTVTQPDGSDSTVTVKTDANGIATLPVTSEQAGTVTVTTNVGGEDVSVGIDFIADISTVKMNGALVLKGTDNQVANNTAEHEVELTLLDGNDNPLPDQAVTFSIKGDTSGIVLEAQSLGETNAEGKVTARFKSKNAERFTVIAVLTSDNSKQATTKATFIADVSTAKIVASGLTSLTSNQVANNLAKNKVQAKVVDANGNPVSGVDVTFTTPETTLASAVNNQKVTTGTDGMALLDFATTKAGTFRITATVTSPTAGTTSDYEDVTFIADSSIAMIASDGLTVVIDNAVANNSAKNKVQAKVTDVNQNPVPGVEVTFSTTETTLANTVNNQKVATGPDGLATLEFANTKAGTFKINADTWSPRTGPTGTNKNVTFIADITTATIADNALKASNSGATVADGKTANTVTLPVTDTNGNPLPNYEVTFTVTDTQGNPTTIKVKTDVNGIATLPVTSLKDGTSTVAVNVGSKNSSIPLEFIADLASATVNATNGLVLSTADQTVTTSKAGDTPTALSTHNLVVTVTDKNGNVIKNQAGKLNVTFTTTGSATFTTSNIVPIDNNGQAVIGLVNTKQEATTVSAKVNGATSNTVSANFKTVMTGITLSSADVSLTKYFSKNITAAANYSDGSSVNITKTGAWSSDNAKINVNSAGKLSSTTEGATGNITITSGGLTATAKVTVIVARTSAIIGTTSSFTTAVNADDTPSIYFQEGWAIDGIYSSSNVLLAGGTGGSNKGSTMDLNSISSLSGTSGFLSGMPNTILLGKLSWKEGTTQKSIGSGVTVTSNSSTSSITVTDKVHGLIVYTSAAKGSGYVTGLQIIYQ
ncbi:Ig-like domain-containing protein [Serratia sp. UGAL515B_01]|uniref:Ig-like domain-containing protein n=1 Tax=Serratia sp. UGAL515B_01 TaxID=2986763 RepID=UPI0029557BE6|nr:Ig-like domain-containing protein [Serratia sp. UGAL515B_01]WON78761.1 Ig-like domain-containing protein [Serratia sp. UGAL515B_01]